MPNANELTEKFWKSIRSDKTVMIELPGVEADHSHPLTAQFTDGHQDGGPIWFFVSKDSDFTQAIGGSHKAVAHYASKGHDLFASLDGTLTALTDSAVVDELWNPFVAAWFPGGKDDPKLQLLRFDPASGQAWLNEHSLFAGIKMLLGSDPKQDYKDNSAALNV